MKDCELNRTISKNVLIITSDFLPIPSANGVCAYNLSKALIERGYDVDIISNQAYRQSKREKIEGISIHRIPLLYFSKYIDNRKIQTFFWRFNLFFHIFMYPLVSISAVYRYAHTAKKIVQQKKTCILISINNPLIGCLSGVYAKRKYGSKLKLVVYDVDSFSNTLEGRYISLAKKRKMMWRWEKLVFQSADLAIIMRNHEQHYNQEKYKQFKHKIKVANFPMLYTHLPDQQKKQNTDDHMINCVYLGTLSQIYRNPKRACEVFSKIANTNLLFYGKTDDERLLFGKFEEVTQGRICHKGMVSFIQGQKLLQDSDILISIGNCDSDMIPSKTYEYMSFCKPIIHLYIFKEDPVIPTLNQYPNALLLDANESVQTLVEQTKAFLDKYSKISVDPKMIRELFYESTPEFSIDLIEEFFTL